MSKLTKAAKGKPCTVQLHPYCDGGGETSVFAHMNCEDKGMGFKSPDWWGADVCGPCHAVLDGHTHTNIPRVERYECFVRGVYRTLKDRIQKGHIVISGKEPEGWRT